MIYSAHLPSRRREPRAPIRHHGFVAAGVGLVRDRASAQLLLLHAEHHCEAAFAAHRHDVDARIPFYEAVLTLHRLLRLMLREGGAA